MPQEHILSLLDGHEDVLTKAANITRALYDAVPCPACSAQGADMQLRESHLTRDGDVMNGNFRVDRPDIQGLARCRSCSTVFEPITRVIVTKSSST
jgi:hypothetical protein